MKIVALVGSIRENSLNMKVAKTLQVRYSNQLDITIANIAQLPHYNQDDELNPNGVVINFKKLIFEADGVLIVTPEFNWSIPGVLKNAVDWLSRVDYPLTNKPVLIAGASTGLVGTIRAQLHLRQMLTSPGLSARVLPAAGNEILITLAHQKINETILIDEDTLSFIDQVIGRFIEWVKNK